MAGISFNVSFSNLVGLENLMKAAGRKAPTAIRRAVNHTGSKARTAMVKALTAQTGLKSSTIKRALRARKAFDGGPSGFVAGKGASEYQIISRGGDVSLKFFHPVERGGGVVAKPWGQTKFYPGGFRKSTYAGKKRKINPKFHGHAMMNMADGRWGGKIAIVKSGLNIPQEMITGATEAAFYKVCQADLAARIEHELLWAMK